METTEPQEEDAPEPHDDTDDARRAENDDDEEEFKMVVDGEDAKPDKMDVVVGFFFWTTVVSCCGCGCFACGLVLDDVSSAVSGFVISCGATTVGDVTEVVLLLLVLLLELELESLLLRGVSCRGVSFDFSASFATLLLLLESDSNRACCAICLSL